jgi:O-antigen/teichoic acid export membrane protein
MTTDSAMTMTDSRRVGASTRRPDGATVDAPPKENGFSSRARIMQNISALGFGQIFTWISTAGLTVLLPRHLGDEGLGKFTTAASLTDLCGLLASLGITGYLVKEVARKGMDARSEILNALALRVPLTIGACGLAVASAALLGYDTLTTQLVYLLCLNIAFSALSTVLAAALHGMQEMRPAALISAMSKGLLLALVALVLYQGYGLIGVMMAYNVAAAAALLAYLIVLARRGGLGGQLDLRTWRVILLGSLPFFVWQSAVLVYGQLDVILLAHYTRDAVVGWYGAAYRIIGIPVFVPTIIAAAVYPALSRTAEQDPAEFRRIAQRSMRAVLLLTVPIALGTMVIAAPLIEFLRYPDEFRNSIPLIVILASHMPMAGAGVILGHVLIARDLQRSWAITGVIAAVLNPSLNMLLIPYFDMSLNNGGIGAAVATILTELFMTTVGFRLLAGIVFDWTDLAFGLRCLAAGLLMSGVVWHALDLFLPLTVAIGALVYFATAFAIGTISVQDIRLVRSYMLHRHAVHPEHAA